MSARTGNDLGCRPLVRVPFVPMRLIVARCEVDYSGRLSAQASRGPAPDHGQERLAGAMVDADTGWLQAAELDDAAVRPSRSPRTNIRVFASSRGEDKLEIRIVEVLSDVTHDMGEAAALEKDGVEKDLQELLADQVPPGAARASGSSAVSGRPTSARST